MTVTEEKSLVRQGTRAAVAALTDSERATAAAELIRLITAHPSWKGAKQLLLFSPLPDEPPVNELLYQAIGEGKTACLPRYRSETNSYEAAIVENPASDLREARYGIPEPVEACPAFPLNQLDLVFVPGVAFAPDGARLGRGRGFYDRLLKMVNSQKIGIGFSAQLLPVIPTEPHDARLTAIVTPAGGWLATTDGLA